MINRYKNTQKISVEGKIIPGPYEQPQFISRQLDPRVLKVTPDRANRPDLIANDLYGDPSLFWVLLEYNSISNTLNWPKAGDVIKYPPINRIMREMM
jgi:hypothetical protein